MPRGSDSHVKFCPVFIFFTIRPFPGHPRVNPAPKIGFLDPVGLNSPSRYPKIQKNLKNMVKNRFFGLRQNGQFLTKNGVSKKKSKKSPKNRRKKSSLDTISTEISGLSQLQPVFHPFDNFATLFFVFFLSLEHPWNTPGVPRTFLHLKTQKNVKKSVKRVKPRFQLTQNTFLGRNCVQRRLFSSIFWTFL